MKKKQFFIANKIRKTEFPHY